jgi:hypothetical protein
MTERVTGVTEEEREMRLMGMEETSERERERELAARNE